MSLTGTKLVGDNPERGRVENDYYATPFKATEDVLNALLKSGETLGNDTICLLRYSF